MTSKRNRGKRTRTQPAKLRPRVEPDPVDVTLGVAVATPGAPRRDTTATAGVVAMPPRQRQGDTTPGDADALSPSRQRHDGDMSGDSDTATRHPTTATATADPATGDGVATSPAVAPPGDTTPAPGDAATPPSPPEPVATPAAVEAMKPVSYSLPPSLVARLRAALWWTQTRPGGYHNASLAVREGIRRVVEELERDHNGGAPFPPAEGTLRTGPSPAGAVRGAQLRAANRDRKTSPEAAPEAGPGSAP